MTDDAFSPDARMKAELLQRLAGEIVLSQRDLISRSPDGVPGRHAIYCWQTLMAAENLLPDDSMMLILSIGAIAADLALALGETSSPLDVEARIMDKVESLTHLHERFDGLNSERDRD